MVRCRVTGARIRRITPHICCEKPPEPQVYTRLAHSFMRCATSHSLHTKEDMISATGGPNYPYINSEISRLTRRHLRGRITAGTCGKGAAPLIRSRGSTMTRAMRAEPPPVRHSRPLHRLDVTSLLRCVTLNETWFNFTQASCIHFYQACRTLANSHPA